MFPFVRQLAAVQPAWFEALPLPAVKAWLAGWLAHPLFEKAMVKQKLT
jgi:glutathione S-transferase